MLTFTSRAARQLEQIIADKGGGLALRIQINRSLGAMAWSMTLQPRTEAAHLVGTVPVLADHNTLSKLDAVTIDWIQTPEGPGFGVFDRNLQTSPQPARDAG